MVKKNLKRKSKTISKRSDKKKKLDASPIQSSNNVSIKVSPRVSPKNKKSKAKPSTSTDLNATLTKSSPKLITKAKAAVQKDKPNKKAANNVVAAAGGGTPKKNDMMKLPKREILKVESSEDEDEDAHAEEVEEDEEEDVLDTVVLEPEIGVSVREPEPDILLGIPTSDLAQLIKSIQREIPEKDTMAPRSRVKKLNWEKIAFADYTPEKCIKLWEAIQKRQRQYRTLAELASDASGWIEKPWQMFGKSNSTKNHPDYPKRPKSAFLLFISDIRDDLTKEHKGVKLTEMSRIAGVKYKNLSESARSAYLLRASESMRKYEEQVRLFYEKHPELKTEEPRRYLGPKKAQSPFTLFFEDHIKKEKHVSDKNAYRTASKAAWNNMKEKKKLVYIQRAVADHEKYLDEVKIYNLEHLNEPIKPNRTVLNKEELQILDKAKGKPIKPPSSAYMVYSRHMIRKDEFHDMLPTERMKIIAARWKEVGKEEKEMITKQLQDLQEVYKKQYKSYLENLPEEERLKLEAIKEAMPKRRASPDAKAKSKALPVPDQELLTNVTLKNWDNLNEADRIVYVSALSRVRDHFAQKLDESMKVSDVHASDADDDSPAESEESDDEEEVEVKQKTDDSDESEEESD